MSCADSDKDDVVVSNDEYDVVAATAAVHVLPSLVPYQV